MSKFAFPTLVLIILALFAYSVTSLPDDEPADHTEQRSDKAPTAAQSIENERRPEQLPPASNTRNVDSDLKPQAEDSQANSDKLDALRSELVKQMQTAKTDTDKALQTVLDQLNTLQSEQVKAREDSKATESNIAQSLRDEIVSSQTKLVAQANDGLKASTVRLEALGQRVDAMKKDFDQLKKGIDDDRQSSSSISPAIALLVALAALVLGPFLAYQFVANQLVGIKHQFSSAVVQPQGASSVQKETPPSTSDTRLAGDDALYHHAPTLSEETIAKGEEKDIGQPKPDEDRQPAHEAEQT